MLSSDPAQIDLASLPYVPFAQRHTLPPCAALYFVLEPANTVTYIGRTISLRQRWRGSHHLLGTYAPIEGLRIAWVLVSDATFLAALERACIAFFQPRDNHPRRLCTTGHVASLTVRFPDELLEELRANAREGDRSLNAEILRTVRQALAARKEGVPRQAPAATGQAAPVAVKRTRGRQRQQEDAHARAV